MYVALLGFPLHLIRALAAGPFGLRRLAVLALVIPGLLGIHLVHLVALLLDEIWFPGYREVPVPEPLFVVGMPRSGTTQLHEALADDPRRTSLRLWHLLFAPAICQRRAVTRVITLDRRCGGLGARTVREGERRLFGFLDEIHRVRLDAPEEDYLLLWPAFASFLLVVLFPRSERIWSLTRLDDAPASTRRRLAHLYRRMVQRHLHEAPQNQRLLSKNPSFTPFVHTLLAEFPDARVIGCVRNPGRVVPSLLTSLEGGARLFGWSPKHPRERDAFVGMLAEFGERLVAYDTGLPESRYQTLRLSEVRANLSGSIERVYARFGETLDTDFRAALRVRTAQARAHTPRFPHDLAGCGVERATIRAHFHGTLTHFGFAPEGARAPSPPERAASLRVALVSDAMPGRNGVGTYYDDLKAALQDRVAAVEHFAPPPDPGRGDRGIHLRMPGDATQHLFFPSPAQVNASLRSFRPDVVVAATPWLYGVLSILEARRLGARVCIGYHTQIDELVGIYWRRFGLGRLARRAAAAWDRIVFRSGDIVLVHNEGLISPARERGAREVALVGTPVPRSFLERPPPPLPDRIGTLVFVGRLAPEKEIGQVLEAAAEHPGISFVLIGEGPLRVEAEAAAARLPNLEVTGWVTREEVLRRVDEADALVLPSRYETFGSAAFEAMIRGRPAIVSPRCGLARWPALQPGIVVMAPEERLTDTVTRVASLPGPDLAALAARARDGARHLARSTVDHWLTTLTRAIDAPRR
ncbi:MAG: sulfotransferase [Longimicrobiales bacterium]|nr:sulfotransferase [Longimicrobiales bacterium]